MVVALDVGHGIAQVLLEQLRVVQELLQVIADLGQPGRDALGLDGGARVGEELIEGVGVVSMAALLHEVGTAIPRRESSPMRSSARVGTGRPSGTVQKISNSSPSGSLA